jgi:VanZ family protein
MLWSNDSVLILNCRLNKRKLQVLKLFDIYLTIFLALIIVIGMLAPISEVNTAPAGTDKIVHALAFAALVFPMAITKRIGLFPLFIFASLFGGIIEILQPSFGRSADIIDWLADSVGVICGIAVRNIIRI